MPLYHSSWALLVPQKRSFRPSAPRYSSSVGCLASQSFSFGLYSLQSAQNSRNVVAINLFGCRMSNTKISPQLAILIYPVYVSSTLCRENFRAYDMKECTDGSIGCHAITGLRFGKSNAARVEVALIHMGSSQGTRI
jgi:hypothetical protein